MRTYKTSYRKGSKRIKCKIWRIKGRDHLGTMRFFSSSCKDKKAANDVAHKIDNVIEYRDRLSSKSELLQFVRDNPKIREKLIKYGVLDEKNITVLKPLAQHVEDFCYSLEQTDITDKRVKAVRAKLKQITESCGFKTWESIKAEAVQSYLTKLRNGKGISHRTHNVYLQTLKQFCHWMVQSRRTSESPIQYLKSLNVETDRRRIRRALSIEECRRLLNATEQAETRFGMTGPQRALLYQLAIETGLRANELRSLTVDSFDFKNNTVTVKAGYSKHRKPDTLPLKPETAAMLKQVFVNKLPNTKAFSLTTTKTAKMLRADLAKAKIDYIDDSGRYLDFHSLRHTTGTLLALSGAHPKEAQDLMRHSNINLTMTIYTHTVLEQQAKTVARLPDISPSTKKQKEVAG